jgi:predicted amidohydrolase YtcJ
MRLVGTWCGALFLFGCAARQPPDLLVHGTLIGPGAPSGPSAILIRDQRITAVIPASAISRHLGPETVVIEAEVITPGLVDAHGHPGWYAQTLRQVDLRDAPTYAAALDRIRAATGFGPIEGHGWDQNDWPDVPEGGWPLATDLLSATGGRPALLTRVDGHAAWATPDLLVALPRQDPPGGKVVRDPTGLPTGVLIDAAMGLASLSISQEQREDDLAAALHRLTRLGLTGVHAMSVSDEELAALTALDGRGALPMRVWCFVQPASAAAARLLSEGPWRTERLAVVGIKTFVDGALGSRGAWLHEDYADLPGHVGLPQASVEQLAALSASALKVGAQVAVHAIGDAGVDATLEAFARARQAVPGSTARLRVEHAQVLSASALSRLAAPGLVVSMQPTHATSDLAWAGQRVGPGRLQRAYAWRSVLAAGGRLAFGSDFPVELPDPALGLWAATRRATPQGEPAGGWTPEQRLSEPEAVDAFTAGAAYAVHDEDRLGAFVVGQLADLSLWTRSANGALEPAGVVIDGVLVR